MQNDITLPAPPSGIVWQRRRFLIQTYEHLLGAIVAFVVLEILYFSSGLAESIAGALLSVNWLFVLGGFIVVGFIGRSFAANRASKGMQYLGLGGYVVAESIIFVPLLWIANSIAPGAIVGAATMTILAFVGLTAVVFVSGVDFTLLGGLLRWAGILALVAIIAAVLFGLTLGTWFCIGMIGVAGFAILYDTSRALTVYPDDAYVSASLELFASVALMFWYAISLFSRR
jgi:FtsH-binding integral membrane protein